MVIKIGDFEIHGYDPHDKDQNHLRYVLDNDIDFRNYVTKQIEERLKESIDNTSIDELQYEHSYLIKYKDSFVGYIRLEELKVNGSLNLQWAVSPEFRNQKLGTKILKTVSDYILENLVEVKKIKGVIEKSNYASQAIAKNASFLEEDRDDFYIYFSKNRR